MPMSRLRLIVFGLWAACACNPAAGLTVAVAPPPAYDAKAAPSDLFPVSAALWFRESLERASGVELVPEPRSTALFLDAGNGAWVTSDPNLHPRYSRYEPVDAVLSFDWSPEGQGRLHVDTAAGRQTFTASSPARSRLLDELGKAAAYLSQELKLGPESTEPLVDFPRISGEAFATIAQARMTTAGWPRNPGESRLILLQPVWKQYPADPRVCAEILRAAALQRSMKNRDNAYNATALTSAKMALPPVLGSPFEAEADALVRAAPEALIPELKTIVAPLLKQAQSGTMAAALDDVLATREDEGPAAPAPPAAGRAWASGSFTRPQMLGALRILAGLPQADARETVQKLARHPDADVKQVLAAAAAEAVAPVPPGLPRDLPPARLIQLANDPDEATAQEARERLAAQRPEKGPERARFDLQTAPLHQRFQLLDNLASPARPEWGAFVVEETASSNPNPYVQAEALRRLAELAPDQARPLAFRVLLNARHRWVRLQAASVAADGAVKSDALAIRHLLDARPEPAVQRFLEAALAKASGGDVKKGTAARIVDGRRNLAWLCGLGDFGPESPFDAYYCLSRPGDRDLWKRAYDAGKIFFVRVSTVGHPGMIVLDRQARDRFWLDIEKALPPEVLELTDGLVFGEETMSMAPDELWEKGWRLFCDEAKLDPGTVAGRLENLGPAQRQAWQTWAYERGVDGFNQIYDFVKRRYMLERPGLQVSTFLPGEPNTPGLRRWKFDVGGIYDYKCDSRMSAYSLVRRIRTLWPGRPVIWLSFGIGGYEMNPVKRGLQVPLQPMSTRRIRAYADAAAAWMAGADTGWFSVWIFVDNKFSGDRNQLAGVTVGLEDIDARSATLARAIEHAFKGAEADPDEPGAPAKTGEGADWEGGAVDEQELAALADLVQGRDKAAEAKASVAARKETFRRGFLFYRQFLYDCARVCRSLPRLPDRTYPALAVHPGATVWTTPPTPNPQVPGMALLNRFDFLSDLKDAGQLDLSVYRLIMVRDPGALPSPLVAALADWVEKTDGLLYIQGGYEPDAEWGTPADHDNTLARPWPWRADVRPNRLPVPAGKTVKPIAMSGPSAMTIQGGRLACTWTVSGDRARILLTAPEGPALAVWRDPKGKGTVVFDGVDSASRDYLLALRDILAKEAPAVADLLSGSVLHETLEIPGLTAAAATGYYKDTSDRHAYPGLDLLTGEPDPVVGGGISGTFAATTYVSNHVAVVNGISVLAERPPERVAPDGNGLAVRGGGLVRIAGRGPLRVRTVDGTLEAVTNAAAWIVGQGEGVAEVAVATNRSVWYVRSSNDVVVTP